MRSSVKDAAASDGKSSEPIEAGTDRDAQAAVTPDSGRPHYPAYPAVPFPGENPFDPAKALLGKALFWDEQLSADDSVACGTCHRPAAGGSDPRPAASGFVGHPGPDGKRGTEDDPRGSEGLRHCVRTSDGSHASVNDPAFGSEVQVTRRRAMSFLDAMFWPDLFWDGRATSAFADPEQPEHVLIPKGGALESQAVAPLQNSAEMTCDGFVWSDLVAKLARVAPLAHASALPDDLAHARGDTYPALFEAAFGTPEVAAARIAFAIATYERTLASDQAPWDRWNEGEEGALSDAQARGAALFAGVAHCSCCHPPPLFGSAAYGNDGFSTSVWDTGRLEVTKKDVDRATFRVPSLRNTGLREAGGLLHDGSGAGADLDTLVHRYNEEPLVPAHVSICVRHALGLSEEQLADLIDFVRNGLTDPRVAAELAPFDRPRLASER